MLTTKRIFAACSTWKIVRTTNGMVSGLGQAEIGNPILERANVGRPVDFSVSMDFDFVLFHERDARGVRSF